MVLVMKEQIMLSKMACELKNGRPLRVAEALHIVIEQAVVEDRLLCGVLEVAEFFQSYKANSTLVCILETITDPAIQMKEMVQHKLIEAFCIENNISLLKVNSCSKLLGWIHCKQNIADVSETLGVCSLPHSSLNKLDLTGSPTCLLVKAQKHISNIEDFVMTFYNTYKYCTSLLFPYIEIPE